MLNNYNLPEKVCNLDYLHGLSNGNSAFVQNMISLFLLEIPVEITSLERGIQEQRFDNIKQAAHKLRSTIPFVGLDRLLEDDILQIEKMALEKKDLENISFLFLKVKEACSRAVTELKAS